MSENGAIKKKKKKNFKQIIKWLKNGQNIVSIMTVLISVIALGISIQSCKQTDASYELSKKEFNGKRQLILKATFDKESVKFSALDNDVHLQHLEISLPSEIDKIPHPKAMPPNFSIDLTFLKMEIREILKTNITTNKGQAKVNLNFPIPIVIKSHYYAQNDLYTDLSRYHLMFESVVKGDSDNAEMVNFVRFYFNGRLEQNENFQTHLDGEWTQIKKQTFDNSTS